jgi:hypothetical protein
MRHAGIAIVLVAASFVAGAAVTSSGLKWFQARILRYIGTGLNNDGTVPTLTLPPAPSVVGEPAAAGSTSPSVATAESAVGGDLSQTASGGKTTPPTTATSANHPTQPGAADAKPAPDAPAGGSTGIGQMFGSLLGLGKEGQATPETASARPKRDPSVAPATAGPTATAATGGSADSRIQEGDDADSRGASTSSESFQAPAPLDPSVAPAILASLTSSDADSDSDSSRESEPRSPKRGPSLTSPRQEKASPAPKNGDGTNPAPAAANAPAAHSEPSTATAASHASTSEKADWSSIQKKMQTLGVTRFTLEGEPGGRVVFSCLIPLAGRQAVSQRFEAEGDDVVSAALAALRRVSLWRAAERQRAGR